MTHSLSAARTDEGVAAPLEPASTGDVEIRKGELLAARDRLMRALSLELRLAIRAGANDVDDLRNQWLESRKQIEQLTAECIAAAESYRKAVLQSNV